VTPPLLIDIAQVSEMTGIPVETLRGWRKENKGPTGRRIGKRVRYRPEDVKAWVDEQFADGPAGCSSCAAARDAWRGGEKPVRRCPSCGADPFEDVVFVASLDA
jgi:predicted DNA-binding transcriptional regulator AlpA